MKKMIIALFLFISSCCFAQNQISEDSYTRYELLDPASQSFRIIYDVTAIANGSKFYFNTLRKGSDHKVDDVVDLATGKRMEWSIVNGATAKKSGLIESDEATDYLQIKYAREIKSGSEYRIRIDKTYKDSKSYYSENDKIIFTRSLGIKRNAVVLPLGYELTKCNYPSQVVMEKDGRIKISFINTGPSDVPLYIEGKKLATVPQISASTQTTAGNVSGQGRDKSKARLGYSFPERAYQTREIVYFLQPPETNSFRLYHDYTETREGMDRYINIVRSGSKASNPSAKNLDTGNTLKVETLRGKEITTRKLDIGEPVTDQTEIVVIWYDAVQKNTSTRLRIEETYTDTNRYVLDGDELVFDRSFGRPFNMVVLPPGWFLTATVIPATIDQTEDGLIRLNYVNDHPDEIDVLLKAKKR